MEIGQRTVQPVVELFIVSENLRFPSAGAFERSGCIVHDLFVRLALALRIAVHLACNCPLIIGILAGLQMDLAADDRLGHPRWRRVEHNPRPAKPLVQSLIRQHESVVSDLRFQATTMTVPMHATQFENIGKIGIELDRQNKIDSCASVVMNAKPLVTGFVPQNL